MIDRAKSRGQHVVSDLTAQEQAHVRAALRFLRTRCGGWEPVGKALHFKSERLALVARGAAVSTTIAFRVARFVKVGVDDLLAGKFPAPGTCPYCGHCNVATDNGGEESPAT